MKLADPGAADQLRAGQLALDEGDWEAARCCFEAVLERDPTPEAWEGLGWVGWWLADAELTFRAREEAFRAYRAAGDALGAARIATSLAADFREFRGDVATGRGWMERAYRLLEGAGEASERGWLVLNDADCSLNVDRDFGRTLELASEGERLGRRLGSPDLEAVSLALCGSARVGLGELERGMRDLEEAAATVLGSVCNPSPRAGRCAASSPPATTSATSAGRATGAR